MSATATKDLRERLDETDREVAAARKEVKERGRDCERARDRLAAQPGGIKTGSSVFREAQAARAELTDAEARYEGLRETQAELLREVAGMPQNGVRMTPNGPVLGSGGGGWETLARELDPSGGRDRVTVPLGDLIGNPSMAVGGVTTTGNPSVPARLQGVAPLPLDERGLFAYLPSEKVDPGEPSITDYKVTSRAVTGEMMRSPTATSKKAELGLGLSLATDPLEQFALFLPGVPVKLLGWVEALREVLAVEMQKMLVERLNRHIIEKIEAADPPTGESGATLLAKLRNGIKSLRDEGGTSRLLALDPDDAASLDLVEDASKRLVFDPATGASTAFRVPVIEVPGIPAPLVINPAVLGKVFFGEATLKVDEYSELDSNTVRLELSFEALCNVRQTHGGVWVVDKAEA